MLPISNGIVLTTSPKNNNSPQHMQSAHRNDKSFLDIRALTSDAVVDGFARRPDVGVKGIAKTTQRSRPSSASSARTSRGRGHGSSRSKEVELTKAEVSTPPSAARGHRKGRSISPTSHRSKLASKSKACSESTFEKATLSSAAKVNKDHVVSSHPRFN